MPTGDPAGLMGLLRFAGAAMIWILPGFALDRLLRRERRGDPVFTLAVGVGLAAFVSTFAALLALAGGLSALRLPAVLAGLAVAALAVLVTLRPRTSAPETPAGGAARTAGLISVAALAMAAAWVGGTLRMDTDAPDHLGTLREILATGAWFPTEAFHLGAGDLGLDPRKGLLHPVYAALAAMSGLDPVELWRLLPALTAVFPFLAGYGFLRGCGYRAGWAVVGSWALVLCWNGGPGLELFGISAYPNQVAAALFWLGFGVSVAVLRRPGWKSVLLAALILSATVTVHPMFVVFVPLLGGILLLWAAGPARPRASALRAVSALGGMLTLLLVPYLLYRFTQYAPANSIHTEVQGMLFFGEHAFVADPAQLWWHLGWAGLVGYPLAVAVFFTRWRRGPAPFAIFAALIIMALLTLNPLFVPVLQQRIGYLVFRSLWLLPAGLAVGAALPLLLVGERRALTAGSFALRPPSEAARPSAAPRRLARLGAALLAAAVLVPALATFPRWLRTEEARDAAFDPRPWRAALLAVDAALPPRSTVLSDPVTSYMLPAFTTQRVVAPYDQHSSPNDSLALGRILAARDVLSPSVPLLDAWEITRRWGGEYLLVNTAFRSPLRTDYWSYDAEALAARKQAFKNSPLFRPVLDRDGFALFALAPVLPDSLPPEDRRAPDLTLPAPPAAHRILDRDGLALIGAFAMPDTVTCADTLAVRLTWTPTRAGLSPAPLRAALRLDALEAPARGLPFGKVVRRLTTFLTGTRYRAQVHWIPASGRLAFDRWPVGRAVSESVSVRPPCNLAPGRYAVTVTVNRIPNMPNHRIRDYLSDRDLYSGPAVDTVTVALPRASR